MEGKPPTSDMSTLELLAGGLHKQRGECQRGLPGLQHHQHIRRTVKLYCSLKAMAVSCVASWLE